MPVIHQHNGFTYQIEPECSEPPYVYIAKANIVMLIAIGIPDKELPHVISNENASQDELNDAFDCVSDHQEQFLNAWNKIHGKIS